MPTPNGEFKDTLAGVLDTLAELIGPAQREEAIANARKVLIEAHGEAVENAKDESVTELYASEEEVAALQAELRTLRDYIRLIETVPALYSTIRSLRAAGELPWPGME
jgi:hypothetical protein